MVRSGYLTPDFGPVAALSGGCHNQGQEPIQDKDGLPLMSETANTTPPPAVSAAPAPVQTAVPLPWAAIAWFAALLVLCYFPVLSKLVHDWANDADMGHGFFVPVVAGYIVWQRREALARLELKPSKWGLLLVAYGTFQLVIATLGIELFLARTALLITLAGMLVTLGGAPLIRLLLFPLLMLIFMVPIPAIIFNQITFPLQLLASRVAEVALSLIGIPVLRDGNILELPSQKLSVVEACSGIRSLLSLSFLSLIYAYFFDQKPWMRLVLLLATIPIAITANAARVTITGILSEWKPELAKGFFHDFEGWVLFMVALSILVAFHQLFNRAWSSLQARRANG
jgi:exosortase